jgi:uncharacterized protein
MGDRYEMGDSSVTVSIIPKFYRAAVLLCGVVAFCFSGCAGTENSRFYTLDYLAMASSGSPDAGSSGVSIGIGPVQLPEYLNRPQIVTRTDRYKINVAEFDRWAAPLDEAFSRVLAENLSILLSTDRVSVYPRQTSRRFDYQVPIEIIRFDGTIPGDANLMVRWSLLKEGKETRITMKKFHGGKPIAGQGYSGLVSAMSLGIYDLSREIANVILTDRQGTHATED